MPIEDDRQRYFWLAANDPVTETAPEPATFQDSRVTPLIDMQEYMNKFKEALNLVGTDSNPENNRGDFIYISGWWLGLLGGLFRRHRGFTGPASGLGSAGPMVDDITAFDLNELGPFEPLNEALKEKARAGVDVRALGWVSFSLLSTTPVPIPLLGALINPIVTNIIQRTDPGGLVSLNAQTLNAIKDLRSEPAMAKGGVLNVLSHSAGAVHIKGAVIGTKPDAMGKTKAIAFTGGLDMVEDRWAMHRHDPDPAWDDKPKLPRWHDIQAGIEGPAAQGFYNHFRDMWNENLRRDPKRFNFEGERMPSYVPGTEAVPDRVIEPKLIPSADPMQHHVQSLRTIPAFRYRWYNCLPENDPVSYAPNGLFEISVAWRKAILGAQQYIYMEDQIYWGRDIMEWVNEAIRGEPNLRVILAMSGQGDPNDPAFDDGEYLHESINLGLLGLGTVNELTPTQQNQIRVFRMWGESVISDDTMEVTAVTPVNAGEALIETDQILHVDAYSIPEDRLANQGLYLTDIANFWEVTGNPTIHPGEPKVYRINPVGGPPSVGDSIGVAHAFGIVMHSKVTLIDDKWAIIGSANVAARSLYTDWEHSVSFMDDGGDGVQQFRASLWADHFKHPITTPFLDIAEALGGWSDHPAWRTTGTFPAMPTRAPGDLGPPYLQPVALPLPLRPMSDETRTERSELRDPDSRLDWGGVCPPSQ